MFNRGLLQRGRGEAKLRKKFFAKLSFKKAVAFSGKKLYNFKE